jgi:hypothetical protein
MDAVRAPVTFLRTIQTDDVVVAELVDELDRRRGLGIRWPVRGVDPVEPAPGEDDPAGHVAVVHEWDTVYARELANTFACEVAGYVPEQFLGGSKPWPYFVHRFTYLRGIDGRLASASGDGGSGEGKAARGSSGGAGSRGGGSGAGGGSGGDRRGDADDRERPEGLDQSDYLRRLATDLESLDQRLVRERGTGLRAVGVLGTDLFDKLLVLRALRERLPGVVFFTTNLDARMDLPSEWLPSHNLVVASSYGLQLCPTYQTPIPPFRDSYQTAVFAATRMSMDVLPPFDFQQKLLRPRVFEIGRDGAHDLSVGRTGLHPHRRDSFGWWTARRQRWASASAACVAGLLFWGMFTSFKTRRPSVLELLTHPLPFFTLTIAGIVALVWRMWWQQRVQGEPWALAQGISIWPTEALRLLAACLAVWFLLRARAARKASDREIQRQFALTRPLTWWPALVNAGTYPRALVWPGRALMNLNLWNVYADGQEPQDHLRARCRASWWRPHHPQSPAGEAVAVQRAAAVAWPNPAAIARAARDNGVGLHEGFVADLAVNAEATHAVGGNGVGAGVAAALAVEPDAPPRVALADDAVEQRPQAKLIDAPVLAPVAAPAIAPAAPPAAPPAAAAGNANAAAPDGVVDVQRLWNEYVLRGQGSSRLWRVGFITLAYYAMGYCLMMIFGAPTAPIRGAEARFFDQIVTLWISVPLTLLLTFYVIDATVLNRQFIQYLTGGETCWPDQAFARCGRRGLRRRDLAKYLAVKLIARRTKAVGKLIYYPFLILLLMIVSRSSYFDNWDWPVALVIMLGLNAVVAVISAYMLRQAAERARAAAVEDLRARALDYAIQGRGDRADVLKEMTREVETERGGAFSLLSQYPIMAAVLLPSGGVGIWFLLDYLARTIR